MVLNLLFGDTFIETLELAKSGDPVAQNDLGAIYHDGKGVPIDYSEAIKWFSKAAKQGHSLAKYNLGISKEKLNELNNTVEKAEKGNPEAQNSLGLIYLYGWGIPQSYNEALKWFKKAAKNGHAQATENINKTFDSIKIDSEVMLRQGLAILNEDDAAYDKDKGIKLLTQSAELGNAKAASVLGLELAGVNGASVDYESAIKWLTVAADQDISIAQKKLSKIYLSDKWSSKDYPKAFKWLMKLAEQGDVESQYLVGGMYATGRGVVEDYIAAYAWIIISRANGYRGNSDTFIEKLRNSMSKEQISMGQLLAQNLLSEMQSNHDESPVHTRFD